MTRMDPKRLYFAIDPVLFGVCVGGLTAGGVMQLMLRFLPSPDVTGARLAAGGWIHALVGSSSLAAGVAAAWFQCWGAKGPRGPQLQRLGGQYGLGVAFAWFVALMCALWRAAVSIWPLFLLDLLLVMLAGTLGQRMSRRT